MKKILSFMKVKQGVTLCTLLLLTIGFQAIAEELRFLGDFKDVPDPVIDKNQPLKIPNQEDLEGLLTFLKKYTDSITLGSPDAEQLKEKIFMNADGRVDLNLLLHEFRFRHIFKDVSFSMEDFTYAKGGGYPGVKPYRYYNFLNNVMLNAAKFTGVKFDNLDLSGSQLSQISFSDSSLNNTICLGCDLRDVKIKNSKAHDADFSFSSGTIEFKNDDISYLKITDSNFDKLKFIDGSLSNSVFINSGDIEKEGTNTYNNVEDSSTSESLPLKSVGLVFKDRFPGASANQVLDHIRTSNFQPVKIEYQLEDIYIDGDKIQNEVETIINKLPSLSGSESIAQKFLDLYKSEKHNYPEIAKLETMANGYVNKLDALILPGGLDLEPYIYDSKITAESFYQDQRARLHALKDMEVEKFPIRTVFELILIDLAQQQNLPLLLLCRGAQLYNIYKGGDLIENLPDEYPYVDFDIKLRFMTKAPNLSHEDENHKIVQIFDEAKQGEAVKVYANHHQALDRHMLGDDLRTLLIWNVTKDDYIPYALYDQTYKPGAWLTQFHPEFKHEVGGAMSRLLSEFNLQLYSAFFELTDQTHRTKPPITDAKKPSLPENPIIKYTKPIGEKHKD